MLIQMLYDGSKEHKHKVHGRCDGTEAHSPCTDIAE
jgi:hypothetical protein